MSGKSISLCCAVLACCMLSLSSAGSFAPYSRSGKVISCEKIAKPRIMNFNADELEAPIPADPVYIAVKIKPDKGRKISVADYTLEVMNAVKLPCLAVQVGDGGFDAAPKEHSVPENTEMTLLFAAEARDCVDELPDNTVLQITGAGNGKVSRRSTTLSIVPPGMEQPKPAYEDHSYIFFELEIVPNLQTEAEEISLACSDFSLNLPNGKCVAARTGNRSYSNRNFTVSKDDYATLLFAVKAADCIDDMPFKLHYNLVDSGRKMTAL